MLSGTPLVDPLGRGHPSALLHTEEFLEITAWRILRVLEAIVLKQAQRFREPGSSKREPVAPSTVSLHCSGGRLGPRPGTLRARGTWIVTGASFPPEETVSLEKQKQMRLPA